jgi:hypothetical protein
LAKYLHEWIKIKNPDLCSSVELEKK